MSNNILKEDLIMNNCPCCNTKCELKYANYCYYVQCENCGKGISYANKDKVIKIWNGYSKESKEEINIMQHKVWNIINKEVYTEKGQRKIEQLHDTIVRIFEKAGQDDMKILYENICTKLFPTMDIMEEYLKEDN